MLLHICEQADYDRAVKTGVYECASLDNEGFIHCCSESQLPGVVERYYSGRDGLLLLHIDAGKLQARLEYENTVGGEELFPHVYGSIAMDSIVSAEPLSN
ncbi:hypothetical protein AB833_18865 [Chromatiales bacterium (ex Bugula neritina AB1)]|nr:hypothetical protein AB833_18865 [Chromatiales bacterium (ex Bugula neritina AB1)]